MSGCLFGYFSLWSLPLFPLQKNRSVWYTRLNFVLFHLLPFVHFSQIASEVTKLCQGWYDSGSDRQDKAGFWGKHRPSPFSVRNKSGTARKLGSHMILILQEISVKVVHIRVHSCMCTHIYKHTQNEYCSAVRKKETCCVWQHWGHYTKWDESDKDMHCLCVLISLTFRT